MPKATKLKVEFAELTGDWGVQIGWLNAADLGSVPVLCLNRFPVFRNADTRHVDICMPLTPGELPASRHSALTFDTERDHRRFVGRLLDALRVIRPNLLVDDAGEDQRHDDRHRNGRRRDDPDPEAAP
jgi:hypothetical protein